MSFMMKNKEKIKELEEKIKKIEERISFSENSCAGLQQEEFENYESDRRYLKILRRRLKSLEE